MENEQELILQKRYNAFADQSGWVNAIDYPPPYAVRVMLYWQQIYCDGTFGKNKIDFGHRTHTDAYGDHYVPEAAEGLEPTFYVQYWRILPENPKRYGRKRTNQN